MTATTEKWFETVLKEETTYRAIVTEVNQSPTKFVIGYNVEESVFFVGESFALIKSYTMLPIAHYSMKGHEYGIVQSDDVQTVRKHIETTLGWIYVDANSENL